MHEIYAAQRRRKIDETLALQLNVADVLPFSGTHLHWWVHFFVPHMLERERITETDITEWEARR